MLRRMITIALLFITNTFTISLSHANSVVYCEYPYRIFYSSVTGKVYLACTGDFDSLDLITIDPITLQEVSNFRVGGLVENVVPLGDGDQLLILLSEMDDDPSTHDGALRKINALTGDLTPGYEIVFDESPLAMVVDNAQNYAYISVGLDFRIPSTIMKIEIDSFNIVEPTITFGITPDVMSITNDGGKLYVKNERRHGPIDIQCFQIGVIDTSNMSLNEPYLMVDTGPGDIVAGYDNRLFVSCFYPAADYYIPDVALTVIDTDDDTIIESVSLDESGMWIMKVDELNHKLYGLVWNNDVYDPDLNITTHGPSPIVVQFDLTDPTYSPTYFELGNEGLWDFVVVPGPDYSRLFAIASDFDSPYVYYMDIAH